MINSIIERVTQGIEGRFANAGNNAAVLMQIVEEAGDGNYLEIGVLHGGSLCAVGLLKKALGHSGICVGVDPFDGYYFKSTKTIVDKSKVPVSLKTAQENLERFGLDQVRLIPAYSPDFEIDETFVVAYIDGDHTEDGVWKDWLKVKDITSGYVVFHDYDAIPDVTCACERALEDPAWELHSKGYCSFVLKRKAETP